MNAEQSHSSFPLLIRSFRGEITERTPVWLMRQAGRYLPEYRELRAKHRMLDLIRTPELAAEVTLQPLRRFPLDAAIIFADILNPLIGMGIELDFVEGEGPKIFNPVRTAADVDRLRVPTAEEHVGYTLEALRIVSRELASRGVPVLGFAGAPFTLSYYLMEGRGTHKLDHVRRCMVEDPTSWHKLQEKLVAMVSDYLIAQVHAGAAAVQIFDSWVGHLGAREFDTFVVPYLHSIIANVRKVVDVPISYFSTTTTGLFPQIATLDTEVVSVDWRTPLPIARKLLGSRPTLQGNLDPSILGAPWEYLEPHVRAVLEEGRKAQPYVFNLGHGVLPHTPADNIARLVELVRSEGAA